VCVAVYYHDVGVEGLRVLGAQGLVGRGAARADHEGLTHLHTSQLNVNTFCGICWMFDGVTITKMAQVEMRNGQVGGPADDGKGHVELPARRAGAVTPLLFGSMQAHFVGFVGCIELVPRIPRSNRLERNDAPNVSHKMCLLFGST